MFTPEDCRTLMHGFRFFDAQHHYDGRSLWKSASLRTELAGAWQFLAPQVMREWLASEPRSGDKGGPGSRCAGWWCFEARERRRRINGEHPFDRAERKARVAELLAVCPSAGNFTSLMYGCPSDFIVRDDYEAVYESQAEYIERLGLWLPGEKERYEAMTRGDDDRPNHPPTSIGGGR